jgi:hypothetical protein
MEIKGIIHEDFVNYKVCSMTIAMPYCTFKCDKECGSNVCQNSKLVKDPTLDIPAAKIIEQYLYNPLSHAIVFQGLEPFDSYNDLYYFIYALRFVFKNDDPVIIYTGYNKDEISSKIEDLRKFSNIIIKFGRYIPDQKPHYDEILGVNLASDNQYAEVITEP